MSMAAIFGLPVIVCRENIFMLTIFCETSFFLAFLTLIWKKPAGVMRKQRGRKCPFCKAEKIKSQRAPLPFFPPYVPTSSSSFFNKATLFQCLADLIAKYDSFGTHLPYKPGYDRWSLSYEKREAEKRTLFKAMAWSTYAIGVQWTEVLNFFSVLEDALSMSLYVINSGHA